MKSEDKVILESEIIEEWDKPMVCPIDPKELSECEACQ